MFHAFCQERQCLTKAVKDDIADVCQTTIRLEDNFIDLAFEMGPVEGMKPKEIKKYIRYIADWRLGQLGLKPIYMIDEHPLPWLTPLLNGVEHANFFETRATEYSKAATRGQWNDVWDSFDKRQRPRPARPPTKRRARPATCSRPQASRRSELRKGRASARPFLFRAMTRGREEGWFVWRRGGRREGRERRPLPRSVQPERSRRPRDTSAPYP